MSNVAHALRVAYEQLLSTLEAAIIEYRNHARVSSPLELRRAIDGFARNYMRIPALRDELERRSTFVAESCASGTPYREAKIAAIRRMSASALRGIMRNRNPGWAWNLAWEADWIKRHRSSLKLASKVSEATTVWRSECERIFGEADDLGADGCSLIAAAHEGHRKDNWIRTMFEDENFAGVHLDEVRKAAESLMAFAEDTLANGKTGRNAESAETGAARENTKTRMKKRGRKSLPPEEANRRMDILSLWEQARTSRIPAKQFCREHKPPLSTKELDRFVAWKATRDRRKGQS